MRCINYFFVFVLLFCYGAVSSETVKDAAYFKKKSSLNSKSFIAEMKQREVEELAKSGGKKENKEVETEMRFNSLIQYRLANFKSPIGTTPETVMLYTALTNLLDEMREINGEINFLNIEIEEATNADNAVTTRLKITNAYGEDVSAKEALSDMYVLKSKIRAMRADRAAVGIAITLVTLKITGGALQAVSGILGALSSSGEISAEDKKNMEEGIAIVAQLSTDLGMNGKSLNDLNRFIKSETGKREAAIDQHIENIKAMGGDLGKLRF